jgi:hypothetical protein
LNKAPLWKKLQNPKDKEAMRITEYKIQETSKLQQKTFLMFQEICLDKNEKHLINGKKILEALQCPKHEKNLLEKIVNFLSEERKISKMQFLNLKKLQATTEELQKQALKTRSLPCHDTKIDQILEEKLKILTTFLTTTKKTITL